MAKDSTRLAIIERALSDTIDRLDELPATPRTRLLRVRAVTYQQAAQRWRDSPPTVEQREAMVDLVLALNIEVMKAAEDAGVL